MRGHTFGWGQALRAPSDQTRDTCGPWSPHCKWASRAWALHTRLPGHFQETKRDMMRLEWSFRNECRDRPAAILLCCKDKYTGQTRSTPLELWTGFQRQTEATPPELLGGVQRQTHSTPPERTSGTDSATPPELLGGVQRQTHSTPPNLWKGVQGRNEGHTCLEAHGHILGQAGKHCVYVGFLCHTVLRARLSRMQSYIFNKELHTMRRDFLLASEAG